MNFYTYHARNRNTVYAYIFVVAVSVGTMQVQTSIAASAAPLGIVQAIQEEHAADIIVQIDTIKIESAIEKWKAAAALDIDHDAFETEAIEDEDILEFKVKQYRKIKMRILRSMGKTGITVQNSYPNLPMMFVTVTNLDTLEKLVRHVDITAVYENIAHQHALIESLPLVSQPIAHSLGKNGIGTTVAVLDTGVNYTLAAFGSCTSPGVPIGCRVVVAQDIAFTDNALDDSGHGTNVAAIVAAVAPGTRIASLDIFNGIYALTSDIIAAINWTIANKTTYNIVAFNLSLGDGTENAGECPTAWSTAPFADARAVGILPIVAVGNNGFINGINGPACSPGAVRVGAVYDSQLGAMTWSTLCTDYTTTADQVPCFSNSAATLTLLAPGSVIYAGGFSFSGTSQASPYVAGAVAILRAADAFPTESLDQTVARLQNSGDLVADGKNGRVTPRLNLERALLAP